MENQVVVEKKSLPDKVNNKVLGAVVVGTTYALTAVPAHAASSLSAVGTSFTDELDGAKAVIITILSGAAIVLGLLVGWRYMKRGGNSA